QASSQSSGSGRRDGANGNRRSAALALFEDAPRGAKLIRRALTEWDTFMLRDLLPNPAAGQYWQDVSRVRPSIP
ncbi:hypothetical protein U1Q18_029424, partial [Sarracenia purpurea var. burkii]